MRTKWLLVAALGLILGAARCAPKRVATPPVAPLAKQNVFALLPEPAGTSSGIVVKNQAGAQELSQPYQAVRVQRADVAPGAPVTLDQADVRRLFGSRARCSPRAGGRVRSAF
jgi:hypothetical protein